VKRKASISHDEAVIRELRENPDFAAEYLRAALEDNDEPRVLLERFRNYCGLIKVARSGFPWEKTTKGDMASVYTNCETALIALRRIAEARGGIAKVAKAAGVERESLYRALSANGNPRLSTLVAVTKAVGLKLTVETA
jgi:probable addiction module antidote protein